MTETENLAAVKATLDPHFHLVDEVWLRHPTSGIALRVDLVAIPRQPLLDAGFPFDVWGIEVKRSDLGVGELTKAFKQCCDYAVCIIDDDRAKVCCGLNLAAVALYTGATTDDSYRYATDAHGPLLRFLGKFNVGELRHHHWDGLQLAVSATPLWTSRNGLTGNGRKFPQLRRLGNGRRRAFEERRAA